MGNVLRSQREVVPSERTRRKTPRSPVVGTSFLSIKRAHSRYLRQEEALYILRRADRADLSRLYVRLRNRMEQIEGFTVEDNERPSVSDAFDMMQVVCERSFIITKTGADQPAITIEAYRYRNGYPPFIAIIVNESNQEASNPMHQSLERELGTNIREIPF